MLPAFTAFRAVWVEITSSDHGHGGPGWEFGTCLWSPVADERGAQRYQVMLEPQAGDLVLHFYKHAWEGRKSYTQLCGFSQVIAPCRVVATPPPSPGQWRVPPYYRIDLQAYQPLERRLHLEELNTRPAYLTRLRQELGPPRPPRYPFATYGLGVRVTQGQYLTRCTRPLYEVLAEALGQAVLPTASPARTPEGREYVEGQRKQREAYFFARNPQLAADAKRLGNYTCEVCDFNFLTHYGELGKGYAECHHRNPLSERPEELWTQQLTTSLEDVAVVCANCHRMLHRRRPALSVEELKAVWYANRKSNAEARMESLS
jgi:hypothetical protein